MPKLVITDNEGSKTVGLDRELKAGRLADNDIPLKVPEASRHHCRFFQEQSSWYVEDMGSSNGTLVNGRKVSKFELQDGDLIAIGAVTFRFLDSAPTAEESGDGEGGGWGEDEISLEEPVAKPAKPAAAPKRRDAPEPEPEPEVDADTEFAQRTNTTLIASDSAFADPTFALSEIPEKKSVVPTILSVLLILSLAGGLAWLYMNREKLSGNRAESSTQAAASNLIPKKYWSFESRDTDPTADEAGWHKEDPIDPASVGEVQEPAHSGDQGFSISRRPVDKAPPATWVSLSGSPECEISIRTGSVYQLGAVAQLTGGGQAVPGIVVTWIEPVTGEDPREIAREVVPVAPASKKWTAASGFVQAPEGASRARIGLVASGLGDVAFDDVVFDEAQPPAGRAVSIKDFRAWLLPSGGLRIFRFSRSVSDGIGIWKTGEAGLEAPWRNFVPKASSGEGLAGTLRDGNGEASVKLSSAESTFKATWQLPAGAPAYTIMIPLPGSPDEINVTLLDGDRAKRMRAAFQKTPATGLIIGGQGDRVRIKFVDAEDKPFSAPLDVVTDSGRAFVKLDRGDRTSITFKFETSFDAELTEARGLLSSAEDAAKKGQVGLAMSTYEQVLAKFPFDENLEKDASSKLEQLANDGRNKIRSLSARVDDAKFFRTARLDDDLLNELEADVVRYAGTNLAAEFTAKRDDLKAERTKTAEDKRIAAAKGLFERGRDYWESKPRRRILSIAFLEMCVTRYPETEWGQQGKALLDQINGTPPTDSGPASRTEGPR